MKVFLKIFVAWFVFALCAVTLASAQSQFATPIQHVIIVVQENRTPDNLFQDPTLIANGSRGWCTTSAAF